MARARILIVEDEALISMMLEDFIETLDYEIADTVESLEAGLAAVEKGGFDMAILDVNLRDRIASWPIADALDDQGIPFFFTSGADLGAARGGEVLAPGDDVHVQRLPEPGDPAAEPSQAQEPEGLALEGFGHVALPAAVAHHPAFLRDLLEEVEDQREQAAQSEANRRTSLPIGFALRPVCCARPRPRDAADACQGSWAAAPEEAAIRKIGLAAP